MGQGWIQAVEGALTLWWVESISRFHRISGVGEPVAVHTALTSPPCILVTTFGVTSTIGNTAKEQQGEASLNTWPDTYCRVQISLQLSFLSPGDHQPSECLLSCYTATLHCLLHQGFTLPQSSRGKVPKVIISPLSSVHFSSWPSPSSCSLRLIHKFSQIQSRGFPDSRSLKKKKTPTRPSMFRVRVDVLQMWPEPPVVLTDVRCWSSEKFAKTMSRGCCLLNF